MQPAGGHILACGLVLREHITVLAAASMENALDDVNAAFTKSTGVKVTASYAASSTLIKQIAQGAVADVFASADPEWMDFGSKRKLVRDHTGVNLLGNQLVLIAPKDSNLDSVPIGAEFDLAKLADGVRLPPAKPRRCRSACTLRRR
jgi:molybdate transport system substrate-binding protein